jgi:signal transduction histidine kinase
VVFRAERGRTELAGDLKPLLARIDEGLAGLVPLRQKVMAAPEAVLSVVAFRYRAVIADLIAYRQGLGQVGVSASTANGLRASASLSQAIESLGQLQVAAVRALAGGRLTPAGQQEIVAADTGVTEAVQAFGDLGPPRWRTLLNGRIGDDEKILVSERLQGIVTRAQPGTALVLGTDVRGWSTALAARIDAMHSVESVLDAELLTAVTAERDAARRTAIVVSAAVVLLLLVVGAVGWWVARSLTASLERLKASAADVAQRRLPQMVRQLDVEHSDPATVAGLMAAAAAPIPVDGRDEVGQVAAAFNMVTRAAAGLAGDQAALRAGVGAILVAVSRRLQLRADKMMVSLDGLERDEQDPDRLKKLFDLDHTATLIRRLIANLQILAGGRGGRPRDRMVPLVELLQAAGQEIEQYARVHVTDVDDRVQVLGHAADDVIHLLAELVDNAARFSPPDSAVVVEARRVGDQLHIHIRDEGIGMGPDELRAAQDRVANPHRLGRRTTQQMGLPVVGALAHRLKVKVEFRSRPRQGTRVDLTIPAELFTCAMAQRVAGLEERTTELAAIGVGVAALPPVWPPPLPQPGVAVPTAEPLIFDQLWHDPSHSWFRVPNGGDAATSGSHPGPAPAPAGWAAAQAAAVAGAAAPTRTTSSGLPVRNPGLQVIPVDAPSAAAQVPVQRKPDRVRAQMAAFQHGLVRAGRTAHDLPRGQR